MFHCLLQRLEPKQKGNFLSKDCVIMGDWTLEAQVCFWSSRNTLLLLQGTTLLTHVSCLNNSNSRNPRSVKFQSFQSNVKTLPNLAKVGLRDPSIPSFCLCDTTVIPKIGTVNAHSMCFKVLSGLYRSHLSEITLLSVCLCIFKTSAKGLD